jgi:hypothetical protein
MTDIFTIEEANLVCVFSKGSRQDLISRLEAAIPDFEEAEMAEIAEGALRKLSKMGDGDFAALELYPEYGDYEKED